MDLLRQPFAVLSVLLFWGTVVYIGWAAAHYLRSITKDSFVYGWSKLPLAGQYIISAAVGFLLFGLFSVIAYALSLPSWCLVVFYLASLIGAGVYSGLLIRRQGFMTTYNVRGLIRTVQSVRLVSPLGIMFMLVGVELLLTLFIGGFMGADGLIHVSKIRHLVENGFTLTDAYFGTVPETRHTLSILHTLMSIPSALGIDPITSWYASAVLFKLTMLSMVYYFAWRLLYQVSGKLRTQYAAFAVILYIALFGNYFISYPANFVIVWVMLFTVALLDVLKKRSYWLFIISCGLVSLTHPLAAAACALLLPLLVLLLLVFDRKTISRKFLATMAGSVLVLLSTPLFGYTLPNRMTELARNLGAKDFAYYRFGPEIVFLPTQRQYFAYNALFTTLVYALSWAGIIGVFIYIKDKQYRILMAALLLFVPLVLYNPITYIPLAHVLPAWAISRITVANQLTLVLPLFGFLLAVWLVRKLIKAKVPDGVYLGVVTVAVLVVFGLTQSLGAVDPIEQRNTFMYRQQKVSYRQLDEIKDVLPDEKGAVILANQSLDSFIIPVVSQLHVVAIQEANATPAADMDHRKQCQELLYKTLDAGLLKQAKVTYVLADKGDSKFYDLASTKPYLTPVKGSETRTLYKFDASSVEPANDPACNFEE